MCERYVSHREGFAPQTMCALPSGFFRKLGAARSARRGAGLSVPAIIFELRVIFHWTGAFVASCTSPVPQLRRFVSLRSKFANVTYVNMIVVEMRKVINTGVKISVLRFFSFFFHLNSGA